MRYDGAVIPRRAAIRASIDGVAILHWREQRAQKQHQAIRILVVATDGLADEIFRITADLAHRRMPLHLETVFAHDRHVEFGGTHVIQRVPVVEQPDHRPDCAARIVVLGLREKQRGASFDIAQVDVVAQRRTHDPAPRRHREHDFRFGIVPFRHRVKADIGPRPHGRQNLRLGEHLCIRSNADLEILAPQSFRFEGFLDRRRFR